MHDSPDTTGRGPRARRVRPAARTSPAPAAAAPAPATGLPADLVRELERGGYYPALVADVVALSLAGEEVRDHLVHLETTFDTDEVRRHATVMVITPTRLLVAHVDDHHGQDRADPSAPGESAPGAPPVAASSVESVPLHRVGPVLLSHRVVDPARHRPGQAPAELVLGLSWGAVRRIDLEPATCGDPDCEADHGYTGTVAGDDVSLRVSADAEGVDAVRAAARFARSLTEATHPPAPAGPGTPAARG